MIEIIKGKMNSANSAERAARQPMKSRILGVRKKREAFRAMRLAREVERS